MTLRVCLNKSIFLLLSLSRELSPFLLHEHVLNLLVSKLFILSLHSRYKFHLSCFVLSHFNSFPPASLSSLPHFNCDFHDYLTRCRSDLRKMSLRYQFAISSHSPIIWKDILFITSGTRRGGEGGGGREGGGYSTNFYTP